MENINKSQIKEILVQYSKAIFIVVLLYLLLLTKAHAADSTGIGDLDTHATEFQKGIKVFAKWGGILLVMISGVVIGMGKAQGQVASYLMYGVIAVGLILAGWGWFDSSFTSGFVF